MRDFSHIPREIVDRLIAPGRGAVADRVRTLVYGLYLDEFQDAGVFSVEIPSHRADVVEWGFILSQLDLVIDHCAHQGEVADIVGFLRQDITDYLRGLELLDEAFRPKENGP